CHGLYADRISGWAHWLAVLGVRDYARGCSRRLWNRGAHVVATHELALRASSRQGKSAHSTGQSWLRTYQSRLRAAARWRPPDALVDRHCGSARDAIGLAAVQVFASGAGAGRGPKPHHLRLRSRTRCVLVVEPSQLARSDREDRRVSGDALHLVSHCLVGWIRRFGGEGLAGAGAFHGRHVSGSLRHRVAGTRSARIAGAGQTSTVSGPVRCRADRAERRLDRAVAG